MNIYKINIKIKNQEIFDKIKPSKYKNKIQKYLRSGKNAKDLTIYFYTKINEIPIEIKKEFDKLSSSLNIVEEKIINNKCSNNNNEKIDINKIDNNKTDNNDDNKMKDNKTNITEKKVENKIDQKCDENKNILTTEDTPYDESNSLRIIKRELYRIARYSKNVKIEQLILNTIININKVIEEFSN